MSSFDSDHEVSGSVSAFELRWEIESSGDVQTPFRGPRRFRLEEPEGVLDRWLREFRDEHTGGSSPPPLQ